MHVPTPAAFALALAVKPVSSNAKPQQSRWYDRLLQDAARAQGWYLLSGPLYARIVWFQLQSTQGDVDNVAKRILDAFKGIVFEDDEQIARCLTLKTVADLGGNFSMDPTMIPSSSILLQLEALLRTEQHTLYIEMGPVIDPMVSFGPVH